METAAGNDFDDQKISISRNKIADVKGVLQRIKTIETESDLLSLITLNYDTKEVVEEALCSFIRRRSRSPFYATPSFEAPSAASYEAAAIAASTYSDATITGLAVLLGYPRTNYVSEQCEYVYTVSKALSAYSHDPWIQMNGFRWLMYLYYTTGNFFCMADAIPHACCALRNHFLLEQVLVAVVDYLLCMLQLRNPEYVTIIAQEYETLERIISEYPGTKAANHAQEILSRLEMDEDNDP